MPSEHRPLVPRHFKFLNFIQGTWNCSTTMEGTNPTREVTSRLSRNAYRPRSHAVRLYKIATYRTPPSYQTIQENCHATQKFRWRLTYPSNVPLCRHMPNKFRFPDWDSKFWNVRRREVGISSLQQCGHLRLLSPSNQIQRKLVLLIYSEWWHANNQIQMRFSDTQLTHADKRCNIFSWYKFAKGCEKPGNPTGEDGMTMKTRRFNKSLNDNSKLPGTSRSLSRIEVLNNTGC